MGDQPRSSPTFRDLELQGWNERSGSYDSWVGEITRDAAGPLLDAVRARPGSRLLDIACGHGFGAGLAATRGLEVSGVDFAAAMVAEARRLHPAVAFVQGDAAALPFPDARFEAATCAFGLLHMADPDHAIAEARRVLTPGGRFGFTVWAGPDRHEFFALVLGAIKAHGRMEVDLPPAPPIFRFSEPAECVRTLEAAGFDAIEVATIPLAWRNGDPDAVLEMIEKGTVRMAMLLEHQDPDVRDEVRSAIRVGAERLLADGRPMAFPAVLASGRRSA